jgi:hypothetical protein
MMYLSRIIESEHVCGAKLHNHSLGELVWLRDLLVVDETGAVEWDECNGFSVGVVLNNTMLNHNAGTAQLNVTIYRHRQADRRSENCVVCVETMLNERE